MCRDQLGRGRDDQEDLADLRWHWDLAYEIGLSEGRWSARFLGGAGSMQAGSADELRRLIWADYGSRKAVGAAGDVVDGRPGDDVGEGERALRRLLDEGVI